MFGDSFYEHEKSLYERVFGVFESLAVKRLDVEGINSEYLSSKFYLNFETCFGVDDASISWAKLLQITGRLGQAPPKTRNITSTLVLSHL